MKQKFQNLGLVLSRDSQKKIVGGYMEVASIEGDGAGSFGKCTVDCTGCQAYKCESGCDAMTNGVSVTCGGITKTCKAYPTCWE
jgi:hypothetical protein